MTATEMGEYVVGAWLREIGGCDFVNYNVRPPVGGTEGQSEFDVVGFHFGERAAYMCEVATHLNDLKYGSYAETFEKVAEKHARQREYAARYLGDFKTHHFTLWSPRVPVGLLSEALAGIDGLELVINGAYAERVGELRELARASTRGTGNPFFRALQIMEHLRGCGPRPDNAARHIEGRGRQVDIASGLAEAANRSRSGTRGERP